MLRGCTSGHSRLGCASRRSVQSDLHGFFSTPVQAPPTSEHDRDNDEIIGEIRKIRKEMNYFSEQQQVQASAHRILFQT